MSHFDRHHPFAIPIDRQAVRRRDMAWMAEMQHNGKGRFLTVAGGAVAVEVQGDAMRLVQATASDAALSDIVFLGVQGETPYFAILAAAEAAPNLPELRSIAPLLPPDEASLAAYAVGLARWHARHGFCSVCGQPTEVREAGHKRVCTSETCGADHFPRTDPAIIVLVEEGDACFLAHNAKYRPGMHSTLAGFVEPGESLEATVVREVWEEAGITLTDIAYHSSQPWPFPASLMVGYRAKAASRQFQVDGEEILSGGWFTRPKIEANLSNLPTNEAFNLPGPLSISRKLIEDWLYNP
jgi:NAD+ diphosphatase